MTRLAQQRWFYFGLLASLAVLLFGWWQGVPSTIKTPGGQLIIIGRLFGLLNFFAILLEVLLIARIPLIEHNFDTHEVIDLHRLNGYAILLFLIGHMVFITLGYDATAHLGIINQFLQMNGTLDDVFKATLGTIIFFVATGLSVRAARKRLPYQWWFIAHLTLYAAILLTFLHQLKLGGSFVNTFWFTAYWYMLCILVFGLLGYYRFLRPVIISMFYDLAVENVVRETNTIYSVVIQGRNLKQLKFSPGQYASWWFLAPKMLTEIHPFSLSSPPGSDTLRLTVKASGDFSTRLASIKPGTRLIMDGPRGAFTAERALGDNILLIAGGVGITPYIPIIDTFLNQRKDVTLLYAVKNKQDVAFSSELHQMWKRGLHIKILLSEKGQRINHASLKEYVFADTTAYLCGPNRMTRDLRKTLRKLGVSKQAIISEQFAF